MASSPFRLLLPALALLACLLWPVPPASAADGPQATVDTLHRVLLETMREGDALGLDGRYRKLDPVLREIFDFERMVGLAAASHWTSADETTRRDLLEAFIRLSVGTYASRFKTYAGERFEVAGERPGIRDTVLVDTRIVTGDGLSVPLSYVLARRGEPWRIIDVVLEKAISEMAVRRSEYAQILREGGAVGLTRTLNAKADEIMAE
jgi:phospholipid transport system substrate-binding protein